MSKTDQAKSIASRLSKLARARGMNYQSIATAFLIERMLARIVQDPQLAKVLVFKGGYVGLRVYESERYTVDLDALLMKADVPTTLDRTALAIEADVSDGVWFSLISQIDLKTQGEYGGVRQVFRCGLGEKPSDLTRSQIVNFDLGIGDPITPGPVNTRTRELIGEGELSWLVYPVETIVAEKLQTMLERAGDNSRAKDIYDLMFYLPKSNPELLKTALERCCQFRGTAVPLDPVTFLSKIDRSLLKKGWKSATASIKEPLAFEEAYAEFLGQLQRIFPRGKPSN